MEPIRVLQVLGTLNLGGAESRIMDLYRNIDRQQIQFDFLIHTNEKQHFQEEVETMGGRIYRLPRFKVYNYLSYCKAVKKFFQEHPEIKAVHGHMTSTAGIYLSIAKKYGVPMTIAHARSAGVDPGIKGKITLFLRRNLKKQADYCFTCSALAGEAVFGKEAMEEGRVRTIPNAIEAGKYTFCQENRDRIRKELNIENKFVIGHVGRFDFMKNHKFLLDVFEEIIKEHSQAILMLLGDGSLKQEMQELAKQKNLQDKVLFLGNRKNVSDYFQAMDYFVFPSLFEGLPGTVVEAQAAGLKCLIANTITGEVVFSDMVKRMSLEKTAKDWANYVLDTKEYTRENTLQVIEDAGFDVKKQVKNMTEFYKTSEKEKLMLMVPMLHQGGFERVCVLTARMLQPYYQVFICVFNMEDLAYDVQGLPIIHLNLGVKNGKIGKVLNVFKRCLAVAKWKKRLGIDVTYSFGPTANMVNVLSKSRGETWCGIRSYMDMDPSNHGMLKLFTNRADKIISCSKYIEEELKETFHCQNVDTLYNPYNSQWICEQAKEKITDVPWNTKESLTLVSMGREDDVKGFWHLLKAFSIVVKEEKEAKLVIVGDGSFEEYKKLAKELGIEKNVFFTGLKKNPFPYIALADIYVLTSYNEGFPNALVEAMTLGVPVIATNCLTGPAEILLKDYAGQPETEKPIMAEYGILIPNMSPQKNLQSSVIEDDEKKLAKNILQLWKNKELYQKYVVKAKERSAQFNYETYVKQFKKMVEKCVEFVVS